MNEEKNWPSMLILIPIILLVVVVGEFVRFNRVIDQRTHVADRLAVQNSLDIELKQSQEAAFQAGAISIMSHVHPKFEAKIFKKYKLKPSDFKDFNSWYASMTPTGYLSRARQIEDYEK